MKRRIGLWVSGGLLVAGVAALAGWWFLLRSDAPPPVDIEDAVAAVTSTTTDASATTVTTAQAAASWTTVEGSFAGFRVQEELARIGFTTAAGRTEDVQGTMTIEGDVVTAVSVRVDTTTLRTDDSRRDNALRRQALETSAFPTATFDLTEPIRLPADAFAGGSFTIDATGDLTIHGVTNEVTIPIEAQFVDGVIAVVGSTTIRFADYAIEQPTALAVLSVDDHGEMEFQLLFST